MRMSTNKRMIKTLVEHLVEGDPRLLAILQESTLVGDALIERLRSHITTILQAHYPKAWAYYTGEQQSEETYYKLVSTSMAYMRMLDYLDYEGQAFVDQNLHGQEVVSQPITLLAALIRGEECECTADFVADMAHLIGQICGIEARQIPTRKMVEAWMDRHPSGLDEATVAWRSANKERIIALLVRRIEEKPSQRWAFEATMGEEEKRQAVRRWWDDDRFHLFWAVRSAQMLNTFLDNSLSDEELAIMQSAEKKGIPIFATPYFLSLIDTRPLKEQEFPRSDIVIRSYLLYSQDLVDEFGQIVAWEKEDIAEVGKPNAAGWVLPSRNVHRRYPNVAIFIPDTMGRACGGLCSYCQRMYDFQAGRFNFELDKLKPTASWAEQLAVNMQYFRTDPYLSDILITGGDAFMSSPRSLAQILDAVIEMAKGKIEDNALRSEGEQYAPMKRVRLGTKIPVYLPQRITDELVGVLRSFKTRAEEVGIEECIVQTHISTAMEITVETKEAVSRLLEAGWAVTNQEVFTVAASRRGHSAKLRKVLNDIGVLPYYNFSVKGFKENRELFATNARSMQEQVEEASIGQIAQRYHSALRTFLHQAHKMVENTNIIRDGDEIPFISPDRNTINLPAVGKSNTFRTIGITADGRRILRFEFDHSRPHSPIIEELGHVIIIESKSISAYLSQLEAMGEDIEQYESIWEYSAGSLEPRSAVFEGTAF